MRISEKNCSLTEALFKKFWLSEFNEKSISALLVWGRGELLWQFWWLFRGEHLKSMGGWT